MSTEISVNIAVDEAVDTRSIVGRHSVDSRSTLIRQSVDSRSTLGRDTVDSRSRCVSADIAFHSPTLRRLFAETSPIVGRYLTNVLVSNWSTLGRWSVDTMVDSQKIAVGYIGRESADSRSIYWSRFLSVCIVFSPLSIALEKKLEQDY